VYVGGAPVGLVRTGPSPSLAAAAHFNSARHWCVLTLESVSQQCSLGAGGARLNQLAISEAHAASAARLPPTDAARTIKSEWREHAGRVAGGISLSLERVRAARTCAYVLGARICTTWGWTRRQLADEQAASRQRRQRQHHHRRQSTDNRSRRWWGGTRLASLERRTRLGQSTRLVASARPGQVATATGGRRPPRAGPLAGGRSCWQSIGGGGVFVAARRARRPSRDLQHGHWRKSISSTGRARAARRQPLERVETGRRRPDGRPIIVIICCCAPLVIPCSFARRGAGVGPTHLRAALASRAPWSSYKYCCGNWQVTSASCATLASRPAAAILFARPLHPSSSRRVSGRRNSLPSLFARMMTFWQRFRSAWAPAAANGGQYLTPRRLVARRPQRKRRQRQLAPRGTIDVGRAAAVRLRERAHHGEPQRR
jgi:hypothetical protein